MPIMLKWNARFVTSALLAFGLGTLLNTSAHALPSQQSKTSEYRKAIAQADGITNQVIDGLIAKTDRYFHDGDYNRMIGTLRVIVEADPNYNDGYTNAAYYLWSQGVGNPRQAGYNAAAEALLDYGLQRTREKGELAFEYGYQFMRNKNYRQAEPYLMRATLLPRPEPRYYSQLALCYERLGKMPQAIQTWQTLVRKFPNFPSGKPNLRRALAAQSMKS